jgi:DNA (cytosine-5)-methyltransferase 1
MALHSVELWDESRAHQLRQVGNGVVPLQDAVALVELVRRAGGA